MPILAVCLRDNRIVWANEETQLRLGDVIETALADLARDQESLQAILAQAVTNRYGIAARALHGRDGALLRVWDVLVTIPTKNARHQAVLFLSPADDEFLTHVIERAAVLAVVTDETGTILWATPGALELLQPKQLGDKVWNTEAPMSPARDAFRAALQGTPRAYSDRLLVSRSDREFAVEVRIEPLTTPSSHTFLWQARPPLDENLTFDAIAAIDRIKGELRRLRLGPSAGMSRATPDIPGMELLTEKEHEILNLVAQGLRPKGISFRLSLSPSSVRNHLSSIYRKLGVHDQAALLELLLSRN